MRFLRACLLVYHAFLAFDCFVLRLIYSTTTTKNRQQGKIGAIIRAVLQEESPIFTMETLQTFRVVVRDHGTKLPTITRQQRGRSQSRIIQFSVLVFTLIDDITPTSAQNIAIENTLKEQVERALAPQHILDLHPAWAGRRSPA